MRVLVVGGAGFLGGAVSDVLTETRHSIRVFDALLYEESYLKPIAFRRGDVRDIDSLLPDLRWADCVIWLAARVAEATCDLDPAAAQAVNVEAVRNLGAHFDGKIIFTSTASVYGLSSELLTEESKLEPRTLYARTKADAEKALLSKNAIIFRLGTLFGLGDGFSRPRFDLVVNTMTLAAATTGKIRIFGGDQYRPFLHVRDAARALVSAVDDNETGVFNLHGENIRIEELGTRLRKVFADLTIETVSANKELESYRVSSAKACRSLGFSPSRSIDGGIDEIRELVESGRIADFADPRFRNHLFLTQRDD